MANLRKELRKILLPAIYALEGDEADALVDQIIAVVEGALPEKRKTNTPTEFFKGWNDCLEAIRNLLRSE